VAAVVAAVVAAAGAQGRRVRVVGAGHSFSKFAFSARVREE